MGIGIVVGVTGAAAWVAVHELPWFGPWAADAARAVVGPHAVAWVEDVVYGAEDAVNVVVRGDDPPKTFWAAPTSDAASARASSAPAPFAPPHESVRAVGDGEWIAMRATTDVHPIAMYKTLVHPDPKRPYAAVAVVAMDLDALALTLVAGTEEPASDAIAAEKRPGLVHRDDRDAVVAVFNGGFKAVHGGYGMKIGADVFLPMRPGACTIALDRGEVSIGTWAGVNAPVLRQTPACLVEHGEPNARLSDDAKAWGASVSGDTIIRRSALGLSSDRRTLFYGLGDAVSARSLGEAMHVAGAADVAELDVNQAFPRFLLVERSAGALEVSAPLLPDIRYSPSDYVGKPSTRDFFYVRRR